MRGAATALSGNCLYLLSNGLGVLLLPVSDGFARLNLSYPP